MTARADRHAQQGEHRMDVVHATPHPPVALDEDAQARLHAAQAALGIVSEFPSMSGTLEEGARRVLSRLDPARATPESVRDALASAGIHVPLALAESWLADRRR